MPIEISCPDCASLCRFPSEQAGKSARCPECGQTFVIAVPASQEPVPTAVAAGPPKASAPIAEEAEQKPRKKSKPPSLPEDRSPRARRDRPQPGASMTPWLLGGCAALFVVSFLLVGGGVAVVSSLMARRPNEPIAEGPRRDVLREDPIPNRNEPPPNENPNGPPDAKPIQPKPAPRDEPIAVVFTDGKFETTVTFPNVEPQPNPQRQTKEYQFTTKADTAYSIAAPPDARADLRVTGPDGDVGKRNDRFGDRSKQVVFLAAKDAKHSVFIESFQFNAQPFKLTIKELDGTEVLPAHLKIQSSSVDLPKLVSAIQIKRFTGAAFSPDNKFFWMAHSDSTLSLWENPGFERKGEYNLAGQNLFALCVDNQGRLYAQAGKAMRDFDFRGQRGIGDINIYENLDPRKNSGALPAPTKRIPLAGIVNRMLHSSDGRWIYGLDTHNRRLFRIDTQKGAIDKELTTISTSTRSFCLTPDGTKIYCCSATNRIDIIDPVEFKLIRSVSLDKSQPMDIGATNKGIVFLAGGPSGGFGDGSGNAYVVDLSGKPTERATAFGFDMGVGNGTVGSNCVIMHPEQHAAFLSGDGAIVAAHVPVRPALVSIRGHERVRQGYEQGQMVISPDGRTLLHNTLGILSVSR